MLLILIRCDFYIYLLTCFSSFAYTLKRNRSFLSTYMRFFGIRGSGSKYENSIVTEPYPLLCHFVKYCNGIPYCSTRTWLPSRGRSTRPPSAFPTAWSTLLLRRCALHGFIPLRNQHKNQEVTNRDMSAANTFANTTVLYFS